MVARSRAVTGMPPHTVQLNVLDGPVRIDRKMPGLLGRPAEVVGAPVFHITSVHLRVRAPAGVGGVMPGGPLRSHRDAGLLVCLTVRNEANFDRKGQRREIQRFWRGHGDSFRKCNSWVRREITRWSFSGSGYSILHMHVRTAGICA